MQTFQKIDPLAMTSVQNSPELHFRFISSFIQPSRAEISGPLVPTPLIIKEANTL